MSNRIFEILELRSHLKTFTLYYSKRYQRVMLYFHPLLELLYYILFVSRKHLNYQRLYNSFEMRGFQLLLSTSKRSSAITRVCFSLFTSMFLLIAFTYSHTIHASNSLINSKNERIIYQNYWICYIIWKNMHICGIHFFSLEANFQFQVHQFIDI